MNKWLAHYFVGVVLDVLKATVGLAASFLDAMAVDGCKVSLLRRTLHFCTARLWVVKSRSTVEG